MRLRRTAALHRRGDNGLCADRDQPNTVRGTRRASRHDHPGPGTHEGVEDPVSAQSVALLSSLHARRLVTAVIDRPSTVHRRSTFRTAGSVRSQSWNRCLQGGAFFELGQGGLTTATQATGSPLSERAGAVVRRDGGVVDRLDFGRGHGVFCWGLPSVNSVGLSGIGFWIPLAGESRLPLREADPIGLACWDASGRGPRYRWSAGQGGL